VVTRRATFRNGGFPANSTNQTLHAQGRMKAMADVLFNPVKLNPLELSRRRISSRSGAGFRPVAAARLCQILTHYG
jgi:hypothetical protein